MAFVLEKSRQPLIAGSEQRAPLFLQPGGAVVHRLPPFTSRPKDRRLEGGTWQPDGLSLGPGSKVTGTVDDPCEHALSWAVLAQRGDAGRERRQQRAASRASRLTHRRRANGWSPPSLQSRIEHLLSWASWDRGLASIARIGIEAETVRFETPALQPGESAGAPHQRGELVGHEGREYLPARWGRCCGHRGAENGPLELEQSIVQSGGGMDRVRTLPAVYRACNQARGNRTAEGGWLSGSHLEGPARAKGPLWEAAAVNPMGHAIRNGLHLLGRAVRSRTGRRTKGNRGRAGFPKAQALATLGMGALAGVSGWQAPVLESKALGRGQRCRATAEGGPRLPARKLSGGSGPCGSSDGQAHRRPEWLCAVAVRASGSSRVGRADRMGFRGGGVACFSRQMDTGTRYERKEGAAPPPQA
ncbi:RRXRR domain-containing protein [Thermogemmatispora sp.]|uniref:RRXRR domain-containing protein n=1 Tax=Thermogemmatispora sp. TaxID=1968838 RepID=UPI0035E4472C